MIPLSCHDFKRIRENSLLSPLSKYLQQRSGIKHSIIFVWHENKPCLLINITSTVHQRNQLWVHFSILLSTSVDSCQSHAHELILLDLRLLLGLKCSLFILKNISLDLFVGPILRQTHFLIILNHRGIREIYKEYWITGWIREIHKEHWITGKISCTSSFCPGISSSVICSTNPLLAPNRRLLYYSPSWV